MAVRSQAASPSPALGTASSATRESASEGVSLLGKPLIAPALPEDVRLKRERELRVAQYEYDRDPHDEGAIIWLGRRLAYLGRYRDAIDVFSNGLALHPESYKLLRHRGHRYITLRKFDLAVADLKRAAELIEGVEDEIEPDGQPNKLNIPTSTSHTNIYYHLGLAHYLRGELEAAADAYEQCMAFSRNDDMQVATAYWQYLTLRRLNDDDASGGAAVLESIDVQMDVIENTSYHRLLLLFKGELSVDDVMKPSSSGGGGDVSIDTATLGYGLGMWHFLKGDREAATREFQNVIDTTNWAAFGHIAAEAVRSKPEIGLVSREHRGHDSPICLL